MSNNKKKNKQNQQVINNINNLNLEIDYDKLAEAIVKAEKISEQQEQETAKQADLQQEQKLNFKETFRIIKLIIFNKGDSNGTLVPNYLSLIMSFPLNSMVIVLLLLSPAFLYAGINLICDLNWVLEPSIIIENIFFIAFIILLFLFYFVVILSLRAVANEISKEKDRNYIVALFSSLVSFAALIIAGVAFWKGVA